MKKYILLFTLLSGFLSIWAQENYKVKYKNKFHFKTLSEETLKYYDDAQNCWENTEESCIPFYKKMIESATRNKECKPCAEIELARGYFFENAFDSSISQLNNLLKDAKNLDEKRRDELELDAYNIMALNYASTGDYKNAILYFSECGKRIDKLGKKEQSALLKVNMGRIYSDMGNHEKSIEMRKKALNELKKLNISRQTAIITSGIAAAYNNNNQMDSAIVWSKYALTLAKEQQDVNSEISGYYVLAASLEKTQPDSAMLFAEQAIHLSRKNNSKFSLSEALGVKGNLLTAQKNYREAEKVYLEAIALERENGVKDNLLLFYEKLGKTAYLNKNYPLSAEYLYEATNLKDAIISKENRELVHEFNTKYETEKKEKQIAEQELKIQKQRSNLLYAILGGALLVSVLGGVFIYNRKAQKLKLKHLQQEKENAILNSFILGEERERNRISHELHDGVAAMIGAAKMSLEAIPHLPEEKRMEQLSKIQGILEHSHSDIRHIAHNLLPTVLEKEGLVQATVQFASEINETKLVNILIKDKNSNANELSKQLQLMLFRVIQELVNNIIKHSQAQNAEIIFSRRPNGLQIEVSDDGIGYDGMNKPGEQGLYSITQRLKSIGGNFKITKSNSGGTQAMVELAV